MHFQMLQFTVPSFASSEKSEESKQASHVITTPMINYYNNVIENNGVKRKFCDKQVPIEKR